MKTTKRISEQVLATTTDKDDKEITCLMCCRNAFKRFKELCDHLVRLTVSEEHPDYRFIVMKQGRNGGMFYDVTIPNGLHGLIQALNTDELIRMVERLQRPRFHVLEPTDEILDIRLTQIDRVSVGRLSYSTTDSEWVFYGTEFTASSTGLEYNRNDAEGSPFFYCWSPSGLQDIF